jgi:hypothetical protein
VKAANTTTSKSSGWMIARSFHNSLKQTYLPRSTSVQRPSFSSSFYTYTFCIPSSDVQNINHRGSRVSCLRPPRSYFLFTFPHGSSRSFSLETSAARLKIEGTRWRASCWVMTAVVGECVWDDSVCRISLLTCLIRAISPLYEFLASWFFLRLSSCQQGPTFPLLSRFIEHVLINCSLTHFYFIFGNISSLKKIMSAYWTGYKENK